MKLHVASKYDVRYSGTNLFKYGQGVFHDLLRALNVPYSGGDNDNEFDVPVKDLEHAADMLYSEEYDEGVDADMVNIYLDEIGMDCVDMSGHLRDFIEQSDENNDFLHFCFF